MPPRLAPAVAGALLALAIAAPLYAQGKSGGKKPPKGPTRPPGSGMVAPLSSAGSAVEPGGGLGGQAVVATTMPFAWLDDASVIAPGSMSLGISMARWQGSGFSQVTVPVVDVAIGLTPGVQVGASVPRAGGGAGTTFFSAKIAVLHDETRALSVAVGPTLEIVAGATLVGQGRAAWGLPVSVQFDRGMSRIYGSSGYFSPGIWYAGAGIGRAVGDRTGISTSFSHAWATSRASSAGIPSVAGSRRNELSGGTSYNLKPTIAVFGSISRTLGVAAEQGAGTTLGFGLSWSAASTAFAR